MIYTQKISNEKYIIVAFINSNFGYTPCRGKINVLVLTPDFKGWVPHDKGDVLTF